MKTFIYILIALAIIIGGYVWLNGQDNEGQEEGQTLKTYEDRDIGFRFEYREEPDGYVVLRPEEGVSSNPDFVKAIVLMLEKEYEELQASTDAREGPPTINVLVFENTKNEQSGLWAKNNSADSNIGLAFGEPEDIVFAGANAVRYLADGLYPIDTIVVANGGYVFMLTGSYLEQGSMIHQDFKPFLDSFEFIQAEGQI